MAEKLKPADILKASGEIAAKGVVALLIISPTFCAWLGYRQGEANERQANQVALERAQALERCQKFVVSRSDVSAVRLSELGPDERADCGITTPLTTTIAPDLSINEGDIRVTLPSPDQLQTEIDGLQRDAHDFNNAVPLETTAIFVAISSVLAAGGWVSIDDYRY